MINIKGVVFAIYSTYCSNVISMCFCVVGAASQQRRIANAMPNPTRFTRGEPVVKGAPTAVYLNPPDQPENLS